jgi:hypothetical protein
MNQVIQKKEYLVTLFGITHGSGLLFFTDLSFFLLYNIRDDLFSMYRFFWYCLLASYGYIWLYEKINWFFAREGFLSRGLQWNLSSANFFHSSLLYSTLFVSSSEILLSLYGKNPYMSMRLLFCAPISMILQGFLETCPVHQRLRNHFLTMGHEEEDGQEDDQEDDY